MIREERGWSARPILRVVVWVLTPLERVLFGVFISWVGVALFLPTWLLRCFCMKAECCFVWLNEPELDDICVFLPS